MTKHFWLGMGAGGVFIVLACGGMTGPGASSSSHWIQCETNVECEQVPGAVACEEGYCVDEDGEPVENDALDGTEESTSGGASSDSSSSQSSSSVGGSVSGSGGSGGATAASGGGGSGGDDASSFAAGGSQNPSSTTSAGPSSTTGAGPLGFTACDVTEAMVGCQGSVCHGSPGMVSPVTLGGGLDLFTADREATLPNQPASYNGVIDAENCPNPPELLVDVANPNDSLIIKKIQGRQSCGSPEPIVGELTSDEEQCIVDWVLWMAANAE